MERATTQADAVDLYIETRHLDYWWGVYGLCEKSCWEDVLLYRERGEDAEPIGYFCICTPRHLDDGSEDDASDEVSEEQRAIDAAARRFLQDRTIHHQLYYSAPDVAEPYEVPFEAERNRAGLRPCYIEIWHPADGIDLAVIRTCTQSFCARYLGLAVNEVHYWRPMSAEEALERWRAEPYLGEVRFADELVEQLGREWGKPREAVLAILQRSVGEGR